MSLSKITVTIVCTALVLTGICQSRKVPMQQLVEDNLQFAASQYKYMMKELPPDVMPRSYNDSSKQLITSNTEWWCSGFYPATLWLLYKETKDEALKAEAEKRLAILEKEKLNTGTHDLGFMIFCSFGNAYKVTGNPHYKDVIFTAASSLATRYRPTIASLQSWNKSDRYSCPVIIDNMMNLELLEWVTQAGGDKRFAEIAVNHANTTIKNHYRPDYSSYHVVDYDTAAAKVIKKVTHQGYADESSWARGQAWGLYGFTMMYRLTKDTAYLRQAIHIADFLLRHPNLPADKIPYWDFNAPDIPNAKRDASAGAVIASALLELSTYAAPKKSKTYKNAAEVMLRSLSSPAYRAAAGTNGGFILKHSVGSIPHRSEIDVPLTYADYYFVEALSRYKEWFK
ncbi:MAG: glycoside hydrolase family 88 protein [Agriterribacter sp.]